jgi:hypothetical protein
VTGAMDTGGDEFVPLDPCDTRAGNPMVL